MKALGMNEQLGSPRTKCERGKSTLLRRAVRWGLVILLPLLVVGSLTTTRAFAQEAEISGIVTDSSGARVPNANVTVVNRDTGISRSVDSNADGFYSVPLLQPGNYMMTAKSAGFATQVRTGIKLEVGAHQVLNLTLQVGEITQTVEVTTETPTVELASSSISAVVNSTTVRELPLNGRSWTDLATLQTGVVALETQNPITRNGANRAARGFGEDVSISGARPQQNNYRLDGISINDHANGGPGAVLGGNLGVDAVQEFSVLTSNYSAEYGRTSGGVVNAITRSGTNQFHGSAYEFLRNSALDAPNFFDISGIPPFRRNQFGASAGGPIRKDKTFIFGDYEGVRQSTGIDYVNTVPSAAARAGNLSTGTVMVDPSVQKYLGFYPLPNGPLSSSGDTGRFTFAAQQVVTENFFITRVDHKFSNRDSFAGTYLYDHSPFSQPDNLNVVLLVAQTKRQDVVLEETHLVNPTLVNAIRFGYNRVDSIAPTDAAVLNPLAKDQSLAALPGKAAAAVSVTGISPFGGGIGRAINSLYWNSFQVYDDAFLTKGVHSMKFGEALERMDLNLIDTSVTRIGAFSFGSLKKFLTNKPSRFEANTFGNNTGRGLRQTLFGLYFQDDWRWHPNLMVNLGLRYEMTTVPTEVTGKLSTLINITDTQPHLGNPFFLNPTLRNFEPRVGFAWDPFRSGKSVLRGGFGLYDVLPLANEYLSWIVHATPFFGLGTVSGANLPAGTFYAGAFPLLTSGSVEASYLEHNPHRNYVMQWNLNVQRELTPSLRGMIGYVGSRGVHQAFHSDDIDIVLPTVTPQGLLWPSPIVPGGTTLNPSFSAIKSTTWGGNSYYHALEAQITKAMSHGIQLQGSFTWGKSIDTSSSASISDQYSNSVSSLYWPNLALGRGLSDFNIGRTLVISSTWQVPSPKSFSGLAAWITNGWELGGIYKANDGVPFTATFGRDGDPLGLNSSDPWDFPNRLGGPGCSSLTNPGNPNQYIKTQCFAVPTAPSNAFYTANCDPNFGTPPQCFNLRGNAGRNILIGPGLSNLDFSLFKNNSIKRISENFNVQFRAEVFNILNRANFDVPAQDTNTQIFDSTGAPNGVAGQLTSTTTTARQIQFALKLVW